MSGLRLLVSDSFGVFIPQRFLQDYNCEVWGIPPDSSDVDTIWKGPETDWYWESWDSILDSAGYADKDGNWWRLYQDGDLWAICYELLSDVEYEEFFGEPREE